MRLARNWTKLILTVLLFVSSTDFGHPEDEFCTPGEDGLDPAATLGIVQRLDQRNLAVWGRRNTDMKTALFCGIRGTGCRRPAGDKAQEE